MIAGKGDSKPRALVFELKGHKNPDITEKDDAIEQLTGYLSDLRGFCSAAETFEFKGLLWFYNVESEAVVDYEDQDIVIFYGKNYKKLTEKVLEFIKEPVVDEILKELREARYTQRRLFEFIKKHGKELYEHGMSILKEIGFYPKLEQQEIINSVLKSFEEKQKKCFFIKGEPGSGKTYIAFMLLLEVLNKVKSEYNSNIVRLAYKNSRIVPMIRQLLEEIQKEIENSIGTNLGFSLKELVHYYYMKNAGHGILENRHPYNYEIVIYDEAQRINSVDDIELAIKRGRVTVFLYDDSQVLLPNEAGTTENFINTAKKLDISYEHRTLSGVYRVLGGKKYHNFIEGLLEGKPELIKSEFENYEIKVFENIEEMLNTLKAKKEEGYKVALVASFTESDGEENKMRVDSLLPIIYETNEQHYKRVKEQYKNIKIKWLMDNKKEYPKYWRHNPKDMVLKHCASVYGCQGFEADYVGVIWGRDFVWRDDNWELGDNCTDTASKRLFRRLFQTAKAEGKSSKQWVAALHLLKNRYRIFLTRGIKGTYIFCEDDETYEHMKNIINS